LEEDVDVQPESSLEQKGSRGASQRAASASLLRYYPTVILTSTTLFFVYDIVSDFLDDSESVLHIAVELLVFLAVSAALFMELRRVRSLRTEVSRERSRAARLSGELMAAMRSQFARWRLSPSETEVALLLIKGLSMREISQAREVGEKTVRQQATAVYAKAGCAGRHELAAHFIEDLLSQGPVNHQARR
jgi:DNA-binding CsgD family transcriptional regulator